VFVMLAGCVFLCLLLLGWAERVRVLVELGMCCAVLCCAVLCLLPAAPIDRSVVAIVWLAG